MPGMGMTPDMNKEVPSYLRSCRGAAKGLRCWGAKGAMAPRLDRSCRGVHDEFDVGRVSARSRSDWPRLVGGSTRAAGCSARAATSARSSARIRSGWPSPRSGLYKGELTPDRHPRDRRSLHGASTAAPGRPRPKRCCISRSCAARAAGAVLHTHSVWSTILSDRLAPRGGLAIDGYEMLKGLDGVTTHEHREWIPILDNDQDMTRLAARRRGDAGRQHPACHAFLLRRHGMYTWGATLPDAVRHVEILEFLLEDASGRAL